MRKADSLAAMLAMCVAGNAHADAPRDGCRILGDTVYQQVVGADTFARRGATLPVHTPIPVECRQTARAVSAGFSRAMLTMNFFVTWPTPEHPRGDVCLGHDLSRCYPRPDPYMPITSLYDAAFIVQQWQAVQASVSATMAAGTESDVSRFDPATMSYRLQRSLGQESNGRRSPD